MILFSDFDKTFYFGDGDERTMANIEAVKKWRDAGNLFCITTGRSYNSVTRQMPWIKELCDYYIVDGGSIALSKDGRMMNAFYFESTVVEKVVAFSKTISEVPIMIYYTPGSEGLDLETNNVTKLRLWFKDITLLSEVSKQLMEKFPVFSVFNWDLSTKPSRKELQEYHGFIEAIPIESGKSSAIKILTQQEGILPQDIITVGDGLNDLSMVRDFSGFAIENSDLLSTGMEFNTISSLAKLIEDKI